MSILLACSIEKEANSGRTVSGTRTHESATVEKAAPTGGMPISNSNSLLLNHITQGKLLTDPAEKGAVASSRKLGLIHPRAEDSRYIIVQLAVAPSAGVRTALKTAGFREIAYRPTNSLIMERVSGRGKPLSLILSEMEGIRAISPYHPSDRVSRELVQQSIAEHSSDEVPILVHLMPGADSDLLLKLLAIRRLNVLGKGLAGSWQRISTLVPSSEVLSLVQELSALEEVFHIERIHRIGFFNDRSTGTIQSGSQGAQTGVTPIWEQGIRGEGQIVGMIDSGLDVDACWFRDSDADKQPMVNTWSPQSGYGTETDDSHRKVIAYNFLYSCDQFPSDSQCENPTDPFSWDNHGHGTHCGGSMVGDAPNARNNGIAPAAKIVVQDGGKTVDDCSDMPGLGCPVIDLYPIFEQAFIQGVRIHNNSYGDNENARAPAQSNYSARSLDVDRFMWEHKDMLIVFAAGNSGTRNRDFSVGSPSTNKNGLSVGSVRTSATSISDDDISGFSSRGWTADGRIKPDLMTPGCTVSAGSDLNIASDNCAEDTGCGTSYAAPIAVGAAALVRQYFTDGFYPSGEKNPPDAMTPSAALLKGMLINSALPLTGRDNSGQSISPIPSNEQGWGRIQLDRVLLFLGATRQLFVDDHRTGFSAGDSSSVTYTFASVHPSEPVKITLVWTDYPGTVDSAPLLPSIDNIANLNAPRLVNDLDLSATAGSSTYLGNSFQNGMSVLGGESDHRNTVEQVLFNTEVIEDITVTVTAANIVQEGQDFALIATGKWQMAGQKLPPEEVTLLDAGQSDASQASDAKLTVPHDSTEETDASDTETPPTAGSSGDATSNSSPVVSTPSQDTPSDFGIGTFEEGTSMQPSEPPQIQGDIPAQSSGCSCSMLGAVPNESGFLPLLGIAAALLRLRGW